MAVPGKEASSKFVTGFGIPSPVTVISLQRQVCSARETYEHFEQSAAFPDKVYLCWLWAVRGSEEHPEIDRVLLSDVPA